MASEPRRACGFRKIGGIYLVGDLGGAACCKLPILLDVCPTCGGGIKQTRGFQWIDPRPWLARPCVATPRSLKYMGCPLNNPPTMGERVGLIWIGAGFYPTPEDFIKEARQQGVSRRVKAIPKGFKLGETWVFLAHPKIEEREVGRKCTNDVCECIIAGALQCGAKRETCPHWTKITKWIGGVFHVMRPSRIEKIVTPAQAADEEAMAALAKAGMTPVTLDPDDKDHTGSVFDRPTTQETTL